MQAAPYGAITGNVTAMALDPADTTGNTVYVGTDNGGIWRSRNATAPTAEVSFVPLIDTTATSLPPATSIYALSVQPDNTGVLLAGTGAGILRSTNRGTTWSIVSLGNDGPFANAAVAGFAWSTLSPQLVVASVTSTRDDIAGSGVRGLYYSTNSGATWTLATMQDGNTVLQSHASGLDNGFHGNTATAVVWDAVRHTFYAAIRSHGYYGSGDGITWTRLAEQPGTDLSLANCTSNPGESGSNSCRIVHGMLAAHPASGDLFALDASGTVWQQTGDGQPWRNLSANLPKTSVHAIAVDPGHPLALYVAMDSGVYVATDVGKCVQGSDSDSCWEVLGTGLPKTPVSSLIAPQDMPSTSPAVLRAATYGLGVWQVPLAATPGAAIVLTPTAVDFGTQLTGTTSAVTNVTISNTGSVSSMLGSITISGDFALRTNTCGASLATSTGCTVSSVFTPTSTGTRSGLLTVVDDAGTQTATLTGNGAAGATDTLSPLALTFGQQAVNTASATQPITLTNTGGVPLTLVSARVVAGDFTVTNGCGATVAAHTSCDLNVSFTPKSIGMLTGTLQVTDVQRVQSITLQGTAIAGPGVTLAPSTLSFANTGVGAVGAAQSLQLTNNGGVPLLLNTITVSGDFGIVAGTNNCSPTTALAVGEACSMSVAFLPARSGMRTGSVIVTSNAPAQTTQLSGTGIDFTLESSGATSQTIASGSSAAYPLLLRPATTTTDAVTYACTGAPGNARCNINAQYGDLSAISTVTVTVLTATTVTRSALMFLVLPLLGFPFAFRRRFNRQSLFLACLLLTMQGCGSGRKIADAGDGSKTGGGSGSTTTPSGTYTLTISATAAGVTHAVPLTLIVR
jgi:hypothetical protein